jgi:hypothetical protein
VLAATPLAASSLAAVEDLDTPAPAPAVVLTGLSPAECPDNGGAVLVLSGTFLPQTLRVSIVVGGLEYPCYSGKAGSGYTGLLPVDGAVSFISPPLPKGGPYALLVKQGPYEVALADALTVRNRIFHSRSRALRQLMPPLVKAGPRRLDATDPLAV